MAHEGVQFSNLEEDDVRETGMDNRRNDHG